MRKTITASVQKEGFEAILYPGNGRKDKVMIVMSGSNGGMTLTKQEAEFYHRNGIPSLALALFKTKQTPKELSRVPVEFVEKAAAWLKKLGYKQIGIDGTSKGSEMALIAASLFPELSCVIVRSAFRHFLLELPGKRTALCTLSHPYVQYPADVHARERDAHHYL